MTKNFINDLDGVTGENILERITQVLQESNSALLDDTEDSHFKWDDYTGNDFEWMNEKDPYCQEDKAKLESFLLKSNPTDQIVLNDNDEYDLWKTYLFKDSSFPEHAVLPPCDIILEGTIPIEDLILEFTYYDENSKLLGRFPNRIVLDPNYKNIIKEMNKNAEKNRAAVKELGHEGVGYGAVIGAMAVYANVFDTRINKLLKGEFIYFPLQVVYGVDTLVFDPVMYYTHPRVKRALGDPLLYFKPDNGDALVGIKTVLMSWYCVQLALLNPMTELFLKKKRETAQCSKITIGRRKAKYVRRIYLEVKELQDEMRRISENAELGEGRHFKCPCWRVIGHWRHYKNGKTIFINGYWKGKERLIKQQETKDRELEYEKEV